MGEGAYQVMFHLPGIAPSPMIVAQTLSLDTLNERYGDSHADPSATLFVEEVHAVIDVARALTLLTPRQQLIVLLKMVGITANREIAGIVGCSLSLVEMEMKKVRSTVGGIYD